MKEIKITYSELMKNLDKFRIERKSSNDLTKDQAAFLIKCRELKNKNPVSWVNIAELWQQLGWGKISENSMRRLYKNYKEGKIKVVTNS